MDEDIDAAIAVVQAPIPPVVTEAQLQEEEGDEAAAMPVEHPNVRLRQQVIEEIDRLIVFLNMSKARVLRFVLDDSPQWTVNSVKSALFRDPSKWNPETVEMMIQLLDWMILLK